MRLADLDPATFSPKQKEIADDILSRRGGLAGPFLAWMRSPELAQRAQELGAYCRFDSSLPHLLSELAILVVARHWRAQAEWAIHAPIAIKAGLTSGDVATILSGDDPTFANPAAQLVYDFTDTLLATRRVSDDLYGRSLKEIGEDGTVDLVGLIGYYSLVALTLNAFDLPVPDGADNPFVE